MLNQMIAIVGICGVALGLACHLLREMAQRAVIHKLTGRRRDPESYILDVYATSADPEVEENHFDRAVVGHLATHQPYLKYLEGGFFLLAALCIGFVALLELANP
jgi:hypothetical protein